MEGVNRKLILALCNPNSKRSYYIIRHWQRTSYIETFRAEMLVFGKSNMFYPENDRRLELVQKIAETCRGHNKLTTDLPLDQRLIFYKGRKSMRRREAEEVAQRHKTDFEEPDL